MRIRRWHIAAALSASSIHATPAAAVPADFKQKVESYVKAAFPAQKPGAAVIVIERGQVVYAGGRGLADLHSKRPITPQTVFRLGSNTKQFTAAVVLQLVQEGKIGLGDRLSQYLPDYPKPGADATIEQLLTHSSEIKNFTSIGSWMLSDGRSKPITTEGLIDIFKDHPNDFPVGSRYQYNNSGYVLLGAVIEKVTGKSWHVAIQERIARPLSLATIRYGVEEATLSAMASGYQEKNGATVPAAPLHMSSPHAAGSLIGSVEDMARWAQALHTGKVLKAETYARMTSRHVLPDGTSTSYGLGLGLGELRGRKTIGHGGNTAGFDTATTFMPDEELFIAVFANSNDPAVPPDVAIARIAAMALGEPYPEFRESKVGSDEIEPFLGVYRVQGGERRFFAKDGRLFTRRTNGDDEQVFPAGNGSFFYGPTTLSWFEVGTDDAGNTVMTSYRGRNQDKEVSARLGPIPVEAKVKLPHLVLERYLGSYWTERGTTKIAFTDTGELTLQLGDGPPRLLSAISDTSFKLEGMDATITFHSTAGAVDHLIFRQGQRMLRGKKTPPTD